MASPVLTARRVTKVYRSGPSSITALDEVSLNIEPGSYCVLVGASGCGKSTLLSILGALEEPTSGEVELFGVGLPEASEAERARQRRRIGFVFQRFHLLPRLPVWENVSYPLIPRGVTARERYARASELLREFGLGGRERSRPEELSGGEQQRVALARAMVGSPEMVLADEPTSNLDPESAALVLAHLQRLHAGGVTILLATHDQKLAPQEARVLRLERGRLVFSEA